MIGRIFPNAVFNLFGDTNQCIMEKGICDTKDLALKKNWKQYSISENYRNAREITNYVNRYISRKMTPVGLSGVQKTVKSFPKIRINADDRVAIIVEKESDIGNLIPTHYSGKSFNFYSTNQEIVRGIYNVIPVQYAKGLEFEKVIVVKKSMTSNQFYVACTRAISELYVLEQ